MAGEGNKSNGFFRRANALAGKFLFSDWYIVFVAAVVFISWISNSLAVSLSILFIVMTYVLYTQKTMLPLVPMLIMFSFMLPLNFELSPSGTAGYWYLGIVGALPVSGFFFFFIKNKVRFKKSRFLIPCLVFCAALICSGLFAGVYLHGVNLMMIWQQSLIYLFLVLILFNGIEKLDFQYLAKCLFAAGLVIATQVLTLYLKADSIKAALNTKLTTETGWGMSNTVAAVLAMCVPAAFYLASKSKLNYIFLAGAVYFILGVLFTLSRGGVLFMTLLLPFSVYYCFKQTQKELRKAAAVTMLSSLALVAVTLLIFWEDLNGVILNPLQKGLDDSFRFDIYKEAIKVFTEHPIFGVGWAYRHRQAPHYTDFYAMHSTVFQYIASGGIVLTLAAIWFFGKRYMAFYADFKPHHVFFLLSLLVHDLYGLIDNTATLPYCIVIAGFIFLALEKDVRPEIEAAKRAMYKKEKFYF